MDDFLVSTALVYVFQTNHGGFEANKGATGKIEENIGGLLEKRADFFFGGTVSGGRTQGKEVVAVGDVGQAPGHGKKCTWLVNVVENIVALGCSGGLGDMAGS